MTFICFFLKLPSISFVLFFSQLLFERIGIMGYDPMFSTTMLVIQIIPF